MFFKDKVYWVHPKLRPVYTVDDFGNLIEADLFYFSYEQETNPTWDFYKLSWII